jgi:hypothetical protein
VAGRLIDQVGNCGIYLERFSGARIGQPDDERKNKKKQKED